MTHRSVRGIVRDLLKDERPSRGWVEPLPMPERKVEPAPTVAPTAPLRHTPPSGPHREIRSKGHSVPLAQHDPTIPTEVVDAVVEEVLDPQCGHKWSYKNGKKFCWLCGGPAPTDRRDSSTRWKG